MHLGYLASLQPLGSAAFHSQLSFLFPSCIRYVTTSKTAYEELESNTGWLVYSLGWGWTIYCMWLLWGYSNRENVLMAFRWSMEILSGSWVGLMFSLSDFTFLNGIGFMQCGILQSILASPCQGGSIIVVYAWAHALLFNVPFICIGSLAGCLSAGRHIDWPVSISWWEKWGLTLVSLTIVGTPGWSDLISHWRTPNTYTCLQKGYEEIHEGLGCTETLMSWISKSNKETGMGQVTPSSNLTCRTKGGKIHI